MKTLRQIEVEPLSEQRWAKIERAVLLSLKPETQNPVEFERLPRLGVVGYRWWVIAAALTALCVTAVAALRLNAPSVASPPSRIITGAAASHLALSGVSLDIDPQSAVVVDNESRQGLLIVLDRGSIVCEAAPRSPDAPLIVQAGAMRVRVVGTRFSVTRVGDSAQVKVSHGTVEVSVLGHSRRVHAGEVWPSTLPAAEPSADSEAVAGPVDSAAAAATGTASAVASTHARASSPQRRTAPEKSTVSSAERATDADQKRRSRQAVFEQAAALERSDPTRASDLYRSLEAGGDSWSRNALYARGRLSASRGNVGEARALLSRYLERFPRGSNAEDARTVLQRLK